MNRYNKLAILLTAKYKSKERKTYYVVCSSSWLDEWHRIKD